jgi:hypothetical protein
VAGDDGSPGAEQQTDPCADGGVDEGSNAAGSADAAKLECSQPEGS